MQQFEIKGKQVKPARQTDKKVHINKVDTVAEFEETTSKEDVDKLYQTTIIAEEGLVKVNRSVTRTGRNDKADEQPALSHSPSLNERFLQPGDLTIKTDSISRVEIRSAIESFDRKPEWDG